MEFGARLQCSLQLAFVRAVQSLNVQVLERIQISALLQNHVTLGTLRLAIHLDGLFQKFQIGTRIAGGPNRSSRFWPRAIQFAGGADLANFVTDRLVLV